MLEKAPLTQGAALRDALTVNGIDLLFGPQFPFGGLGFWGVVWGFLGLFLSLFLWF